MSLLCRHGDEGHRGFPRVSGDEPAITENNRYWYRFSPRERG